MASEHAAAATTATVELSTKQPSSGASEAPSSGSSTADTIRVPGFGEVNTEFYEDGTCTTHPDFLKTNLASGVTVALVSVPLSIALAIASGAAPSQGVLTAVYGGIGCGLFGSSDYNIIGPAGALVAILLHWSEKYGPGVLPWISLGSAVVCAVLRAANLQGYLVMMPESVFEGFTLSIGLVIGLSQLDFAFGLPEREKAGSFILNVGASFANMGDTSWVALVTFLFCFGGMWALPRSSIKNAKGIPWTIGFAVLGIFVGWLTDGTDVALETIKDRYGVLASQVFVPIKVSDLSGVSVTDFIVASLEVGFVAVLETLISARIAGFRMRRDFSKEVETVGLCASHVLCGVAGALPPSGVFVRTSLNCQSGATHRTSQVFNALVVLFIAGVAMPVFSYLPLPTVAAILCVASINMAIPTFTLLIKFAKTDMTSCAIMTATTLLCVVVDTVVGLIFGMIVAVFMHAEKSTLPVIVSVSKDGGAYAKCGDGGLDAAEAKGAAVLLEPLGPLSYLASEALIELCPKVEGAAALVVSLTHATSVDRDAVKSLSTLMARTADAGVAVSLVPAAHAEAFNDMAENIRVAADVADAKRA